MQPDEQVKLDRVLSNADPLLVASLRRDEKRRRRITLGITGGLIMSAIVLVLAIIFYSGSAALTPPDAARSNAIAAEAWKLWQQGRLSTALDKFQEAVKLDPANANAWNGLGWVYFNSGTRDEAEKAWQKTLKLQPGHPAALNGLGQSALVRRDYAGAEKYLLAAAAHPQASAAWWGLARLYLLQGKYEQAEKWAQKIVAAEPANQDAARMLAAAKARQLDPALRSQIEPPAAEESSPATQNAEQAESATQPTADSGTIQPVFTDSLEAGQGLPAGWKRGASIDGVTYLWDRNTGYDGKSSLSIRKEADRYFPIAEWTHAMPYDGTSPRLTLKAMVKAQKAGKAILDVQFLSGPGQEDWQHKWAGYIGAKNPGDAPVTHDWKEYAGTVEIPPGTRQIIIGLQMYGPGQVWFDNVTAAYAR